MKFLIIKSLLQLGLKKGLKSKKPRASGLKIVAIILLFIATIFTLITIHQLLNFYLSPIHANLYFALGFAISSLIVLLIINIKKKQMVYPAKTPTEADTLSAIADPITEQVQAMLQRHTGKVLLGAIVLGLFLGNRRK